MSDGQNNIAFLATGAEGRLVAGALARSDRVTLLQCRETTDEVSLVNLNEEDRTPIGVSEERDHIQGALTSFLQRTGNIDAVVVMAHTVQSRERPEGFTSLTTLFEKHFFLPLTWIKAALPSMIGAKKGVVIVIMPPSALAANPRQPAMSCAYWALKRVCQSLRAELQPFNITVHLVFSPLAEADLAGSPGKRTAKLNTLAGRLRTILTNEKRGDGSLDWAGRWHHSIEHLFPDRGKWAKSSNGKRTYRERGVGGNRSALITGASSGLGRELARLYAPTVEELHLVGRDHAALEQVRQELTQTSNCMVNIARLDLGDLRAVEAYAAAVGPVDLLINCAGYSVVGLVRDIPLDLFRRNMTVNFFAPVVLTEAFLHKSPAPRRIVNVLSTTAIAGRKKQSSYSATKAALWAYTRILRQTAPAGTEVMEALPATFTSNFADNVVDAESGERLGRSAVHRGQDRHGLTSELVAARVYRASEHGCHCLFVPYKARLFHLLEVITPGLFQRMFP